MTKSNKKTRRSAKGGKMVALMQELVKLNKQQVIKDLPDSLDVEWPVYPRHLVHTFVRKLDLGYITPSVTVETDGSYTFVLSSLPDYTEFTALFDTYRIMFVRVEFFALFTDTSATVAYPPIVTAIDYDDNTATTFSVLQEYDTSLLSQTGTFFTRVLKPRIAVAAYSGAFTSFAQSKPGQWIDCASPGVVHYGLKYAMPISGAANQVWKTEATYYMQFRESR